MKKSSANNSSMDSDYNESFLMFKLKNISNVKTTNIHVKLKLALFIGKRVADDLNRKPCLIQLDCDPVDNDETSFKFEMEHIF